jgi:hypothetical protein
MWNGFVWLIQGAAFGVFGFIKQEILFYPNEEN